MLDQDHHLLKNLLENEHVKFFLFGLRVTIPLALFILSIIYYWPLAVLIAFLFLSYILGRMIND